jgi:hypothetical protein
MEHATTKSEKQDIIKRFDNEVSNLLNQKIIQNLSNQLDSRKPISESVENKFKKVLLVVRQNN